MQKSKVQFKIQSVILPTVIICLAAALRLVPHVPNFAPIGAMALFGGAYLDRRYALFLPLAAMVVSDMFIGFSQSTPFVYGSFILIGLIGMWLKTRRTVGTVIGASLVSSLLFFLITNLNFALAYSLYPKTLEGQIQSYVYALPFFRNTILGDLFYTTLFFGGYEAIRYYFELKSKKLEVKSKSYK